MNSKNINDKEYSKFSQNGEDGIIEFLSDKLISNNKHFVEIGCGFGLENNSTNLILNGWSGTVFDMPYNIHLYKRFLELIKPQKDIKYISGVLNLENLEKLINILINEDTTFFSLDIDSYDFYIMRELLKKNFLPKIICVEYNPFFGKEALTVLYKSNTKDFYCTGERLLYYGASLEAWKMLFQKYNYEFICVDNNGVNAFFVLPEYFNEKFSKYKGLDFEYTIGWVNEFKTSGEELKNKILTKFKNELINVIELL
tara:strand:+ start:100 stop:867 length:768 start_codon:yes stop_codon:yes gene_type:complete